MESLNNDCGCDLDERVCIDGGVYDSSDEVVATVEETQSADDIQLLLDTIKSEAAYMGVALDRVNALVTTVRELYDELPEIEEEVVEYEVNAETLRSFVESHYSFSELMSMAIHKLFSY